MKSTKIAKSDRNSSLELLRILAMFMIVFYHLILFFVEPIDSNCLSLYSVDSSGAVV